ncbi:ESX secretion-associated protein EspG [Mycobacterium sp. BMJ-28]
MKQVGSISVVDLTAVSSHYGRDFIPFPFMQTMAPQFSPEAFAVHERDVVERFQNGDLRVLQNWAGTYTRADIRVEAHVQFVASDSTSVRVVAHRKGELGYLARQNYADVIEMFSLSPYDLGGAVADAMGDITPGTKAAIMVPEYRGRETVHEEFDPAVRAYSEALDVVRVARSDIAAVGTVQSHWRPTRRWGVDRGKNAVVWLRLRGDGDYLYAPDFSAAQPISKDKLADRIDRLIADDVAVLRQFRNGA